MRVAAALSGAVEYREHHRRRLTLLLYMLKYQHTLLIVQHPRTLCPKVHQVRLPVGRSFAVALSACVGMLSATTPAIAQRSGIDTTALDRLVRPQDDFYRFANGRWIDRNEIPPYMASWSTNFELQVKIYRDVSELLTRRASPVLARDADLRKVADVYQSFMNEAAIEHAGLTPLRGELAQIAAVANATDVTNMLAHFIRLGLSAPIAISVRSDDRDATRYMVDLEQSGLGLPDRDYYSSTDARFQNIRNKYHDHIARVLALSGDRDATRNADSVLALETRLAQFQWTAVENRDPVKTYNRVAFTSLDSFAHGLNGQQLAAALGLRNATTLANISQPSYFRALGGLIHGTRASVWRAYFRSHLLDAYSPFLAKSFDDERIAYSASLNGPTVSRPRWLRAVGIVDDRMGGAVGKVYVQHFFPPMASAHAELLVRNLSLAFRRRIESLDWMSAQTKREANAKLDALRIKLGAPPQWQNYTPLRTSPTELIGNILRLQSLRYNRTIARLGTQVDRDEWGMSVLSVNGSYSALRNEILLPAALMQPPYFQADADDAVNYGGLGWFIAHELSHAFDNRGNQYDSQGQLRDWWTPTDHSAFALRSSALVDQYSRYEPVPGLFINGALTVGENIADNLGLAIAYDAYHLSLGGRAAPVLDGFTGDQRFYLSFATIWGGKSREATLVQIVKSDTHAPAEFRVRGALANHDPFYAAFAVAEGDRMFVAREQRVRIW